MNLFEEGESDVSMTKPRDIPKIQVESHPKHVINFRFFLFSKLKEESNHALKHFLK